MLWYFEWKNMEGNVLIPTKIQIDKKNHEFIKQVYKELHYKSLSEYMREAVNTKVAEDRKKLRELTRMAAMEMIGKVPYDNVFESIEGEDFETR
jgi:metal-responsive CopG/Arc/MetJ family transcriptional regulator